jgi:hypothetical protein
MSQAQYNISSDAAGIKSKDSLDFEPIFLEFGLILRMQQQMLAI